MILAREAIFRNVRKLLQIGPLLSWIRNGTNQPSTNQDQKGIQLQMTHPILGEPQFQSFL